jgi:hypothetical protein
MKFLKPILLSLFLSAVITANAGDIRMGITPNPANQQTIIRIEGIQTMETHHPEIFTLLGEKVSVAQWRREGNSFIFNTASIPDGMYLVKFSTGNQSVVKRLKIQHL